VTVAELTYAKTPGGNRIHVMRAADTTLCGSRVFQLVLVETPIPAKHLCEWCAAELEKGKR
jgi:hypothetical protein